MIGIVYFSGGKIKGYVHPVKVVTFSEEETRSFLRAMVEEGVNAPDNIVEKGKHWVATAFDENGHASFEYDSAVGMKRLVAVG